MCSDRSGRTRADWVLFIARDWATVIRDEHQCAMKQASELGDFDQKSKNMLIALGSNATLGGMSPDTLIRAAIEEMQSQTFMIRSVSRLYLSPAFPAGSGPDYVNAVVSAKSTMTPLEALSALHAIEAKIWTPAWFAVGAAYDGPRSFGCGKSCVPQVVPLRSSGAKCHLRTRCGSHPTG